MEFRRVLFRSPRNRAHQVRCPSGRAIYIDGNSLQFRDEPVEHWFLEHFLPDGAAASAFADRLASLAAVSSYAALALPQLLERAGRSEEHTSELQSLMRISYAVFCLKKKNNNKTQI